MIRLIQRRLIIPRGDTGSFSIPVLSKGGTNNIAVFTIFDETTRTKMFQKIISGEGDVLTIAFTHSDTVNLKPGKYVWDIKYYKNPEYIDDELVNGEEIDSYYAGFSLPVCEIRETADNYLVSPEAPTATLSPEQLEIVTGAIHSLNEAIRKTQENVEHYPEIRDEVWYTWDAELGDYVNTGVRANGIVGNGIASAVLNDDYTLTLNFTDGTSFTSTSIRGETGNGIDDIVLNNDFTLTISYTDGESYTTPSIRGPVGATPQFSIGTVQDGAIAAASITGTAENPVLNLTLPNAHVPTRVSQLENDANYAVDANYVHTDNNYTTTEKEKLSGIAAGAEVNVNADWNATGGDAQILNKPTKVSDFTNDAGYLTTETDPTVPAWAKAANKPPYTAAEVGAPTVAQMEQAIANVNTMKIHICAQNEYDSETGIPTIQNPDIQTFYLVPGGEGNNLFIEWAYINNSWERFGSADVEVPVQDVQINSVSILNDGVANMPIASSSALGVVKVNNNYGIAIDPNSGSILTRSAGNNDVKTGTNWYKPITPYYQHSSAFYGLAKAAGDTTQSQSSNAVGTYTEEAKTAIQTMLDVPSKTDIPTQVSQLTNDAGYLTDDTDKADVIVNTASGAVASFSDGADDLPVQDLVVQIEPVQAGSGDPSPENVRPITGWTGVKVTRTGKNLFDPQYFTGDVSTAYLTFHGSRTVSYAHTTPVKANTEYICSIVLPSTPSAAWGVYGRFADAPSTNVVFSPNGTSNPRTFTFTPSSDTELVMWAYITGSGGTWNSSGITSVGNIKVQLELGSTATDYESYQCRTYDIEFPTEAGTVYGGSLDVTTGVLTVDRATITMDGSQSVSESQQKRFYTSIPSAFTVNASNQTTYKGVISDKFQSFSWGGLANASIGCAPVWGHGIAYKHPNIDTAGDWKVYFTNNPTVFSYELATPQTYQLTPQEIHTLLGQNNIWADTGDTAVTYPADTKMFVEQNAPESPVQDVQVNGVSVLSDGVANVPVGGTSNFGVFKVDSAYGTSSANGVIRISAANNVGVKNGSNGWTPIVPSTQNAAAFYGLAKAAGSDEKSSTLPVGQYTDNAKEAIQSMLGVSQMLAPTNPNLVASQAYAIGDVFAANGHLYKATAAIAQDEAIIPDTNCVETTMAEAGGKIKDVQVAGTSVVGNDGIANVPMANDNGTLGVVRIYGGYATGIGINSGGYLSIRPTTNANVKAGNGTYTPVTSAVQHASTFYGLAKAAGDTTQSASSNEVGQYTDEAKLAIRSMLGAASEPAVAAKYTKPSTGIPASDLTSAVQTSLGKADTALQSAPVTSVNGSTGAVVLSIPSTAADVGAIAAPASPATGAFLVWSGNAWTAQTLATWKGGSF